MKWSCLLYVFDLHKFGCSVVFEWIGMPIILFFRRLKKIGRAALGG